MEITIYNWYKIGYGSWKTTISGKLHRYLDILDMSQIDKNNITMIGSDTTTTNINIKDHAYARCLRRQIKIYKEN